MNATKNVTFIDWLKLKLGSQKLESKRTRSLPIPFSFLADNLSLSYYQQNQSLVHFTTPTHLKEVFMSKTRIVAVLVMITLSSSATFGDEKSEAIKAITPEVQTAKWAVKWWMPRHKQKLADLKKQETVDLLMIGDSITHGWEGRGKKVWDKHYAHRNAFNIGFSGDRTEQVIWRLQHGAVDGISPKLAVVMIGTNNTGHRQDKPEHTAAGIKAILGELKKRLPKTKVLLLAIFPRGKDPQDKLRQLNDATNEIISGFADNKRVDYLDINKTFLTDEGVLTKEVMPDLLHPHEKGYAMWAAAMEPKIAELLGE